MTRSRLRRHPASAVVAAAATTAGMQYRHLVMEAGPSFGLRPGEHRRPGRAQNAGIEVETWKPYAPGDDLRHLDWTVLGRLDALLVRRFAAEHERVVHLLFDASGSMADDKGIVATELLTALGAIALASGHAVRLVVLGEPRSPWISPLYRRAASLRRLAAVLGAVEPAGRLELAASLGDWARRRPERAATVLVSDLLVDPGSLAPALHELAAGGIPLFVVQVLGPAELRPETCLVGGMLEDAENGALHPLILDQRTLEQYRAVLQQYLRALEALAEAAHASYARLETPRPVPDFVHTDLVRLGLLRPRGR